MEGGRRWQIAGAEKDNDVRFVLNRLWNVYKHRRLPLTPTLAREGGR